MPLPGRQPVDRIFDSADPSSLVALPSPDGGADAEVVTAVGALAKAGSGWRSTSPIVAPSLAGVGDQLVVPSNRISEMSTDTLKWATEQRAPNARKRA